MSYIHSDIDTPRDSVGSEYRNKKFIKRDNADYFLEQDAFLGVRVVWRYYDKPLRWVFLPSTRDFLQAALFISSASYYARLCSRPLLLPATRPDLSCSSPFTLHPAAPQWDVFDLLSSLMTSLHFQLHMFIYNPSPLNSFQPAHYFSLSISSSIISSFLPLLSSPLQPSRFQQLFSIAYSHKRWLIRRHAYSVISVIQTLAPRGDRLPKSHYRFPCVPENLMLPIASLF